jgi:DNA-binding NtrC family response regulator
MKASILLISSIQEHYWEEVLEKALEPLARVQMGKEEEAIALILSQSFDAIIIDTMTVMDVPLLVSCIRAQRHDSRIIVATNSLTWTRARDAFHAGATDYIGKSLNKEEILITFQNELSKIPPPWPR